MPSDEQISLREHIEALIAAGDRRYQDRFDAYQNALTAAFNAQKALVDAAFSAAKEAVLKAETANEKRFQSVNEFRLALSDTQGKQVTRTEIDMQIKAISQVIETLERNLDNQREALAVRVTVLEQHQAQSVGRDRGVSLSWSVIGTAIALTAATVGIVVKLFSS